MIENPEVQLSELKKGECFMFNGEPYIVKRIYWEDLGLLKRKVWVSTMKFDNSDWHSIGHTPWPCHITGGKRNNRHAIRFAGSAARYQ